MTGLLILLGVMAAVGVAGKKGVSGIGATDAQEDGARNMYVWIMNYEPLYKRYKNLCYASFNMLNKPVTEYGMSMVYDYVADELQKDMWRFDRLRGRSFDRTARKLAAQQIVDAFYEDYEQ